MKPKAQKRVEAAERQAKHDALSLDEKITKAMEAPGGSRSKLKRLRTQRGEAE